MDKLDSARRSENMRRIRSRNTVPEIAVRSIIHRMGFRFRLHKKDLPGKPDIVLARLHKVVFVHGCFWHQHAKCREGRIPKSRPEYWIPKLRGNCDRDAQHRSSLRKLGWQSLVVWECEIRQPARLERKLERFLNK
jgi:DNA mismatch endonuclease (patch repair protein)